MLELSDYLSLSADEARLQWFSILARVDPGERRQVDFVPIETLLCFGLGLVSPPSPSGNINIRESASDVKRLAALLKRRPTSLAAKLANLDGRRPNGAKHERQLWAILSNDLARFEHLYEVTMAAGRSVGLAHDQLPDFLEVETNSLHAFLEADQVSYEDLRDAIEEDVRDWADRNPEGDSLETEMVLLGTARVGQQQFARSVLENCGHACVFCGLSFRANGLPSSRMLVASHIKPWRASSGSERLDLKNGVAACPTHDAAFDGFLMTLSSSLQIVRSPLLEMAIDRDSIVAHNFSSLSVVESGIESRFQQRPATEYLEWHRQHFNASELVRAGRSSASGETSYPGLGA